MSEPIESTIPVLPGRIILSSPGPARYTAVPTPGPAGPVGPPGDGEVVSPEAIQEMIDNTVGAHVTAEEPHPAYDDLIDLTVLFENRLV